MLNKFEAITYFYDSYNTTSNANYNCTLFQCAVTVSFCCVVCASNCNSCKSNGAGLCDSGQCHVGYRLNAAKTCDGMTKPDMLNISLKVSWIDMC